MASIENKLKHNTRQLQIEIHRIELMCRLRLMKRTGLSQTSGEEEDESSLLSEINELEAAISDAQEPTPLDDLVRLFGLNALERDIFVICLIYSLKPDISNLYAELYGHDDRNWPTLSLIQMILGFDDLQSRELREALAADSPLLRYRILKIHENSPGQPLSFLHQPIVADERIVDYVLASRNLDARVAQFLRIWTADSRDTIPARFRAADSHMQIRLRRIGEFIQSMDSSIVLSISGPSIPDNTDFVRSIGEVIESPVFEVSMTMLRQLSLEEFEDTLILAFREALLFGALLAIARVEPSQTQADPKEYINQILFHQILEHPGPVALLSEASIDLHSHLGGKKALFETSIGLPQFEERVDLWHQSFDRLNIETSVLRPKDLAAMFKFDSARIFAAATNARNSALIRNDDSVNLQKGELISACLAVSSQNLSQFARKLKQTFTWEDIVLPLGIKRRLRQACEQFRRSDQVFVEWGFEKVAPASRGVNILFSGSPGTGKSMAAGIMASDLGLECYRIDLSTVVSKYIGETEKSLSKIFDAAERSNAILFFDEADALFGKRSEVNDAHDRYANIEVGYLLQKMEEFEGMTILATNLATNMDEAFTRRIQFVVDFPSPDEKSRLEIWKLSFPEAAPLSEDLDFEYLAANLQITGANIKNIAIEASFLAAERNSEIGMEYVVLAAKHEYEKEGKSLTSSGLAGRYDLDALELATTAR